MAEEILIGPYITVNTVDLSAYVMSMKINRTAEEVSFVTSNVGGTTVYKRRLVGAQDFSIEVEWSDDFASAKVHATLSAGWGSAFTIVAALHGPTPAATNEVWTDTMHLFSLPAGGGVGEHMTKSSTFMHASGTPTADITP